MQQEKNSGGLLPLFYFHDDFTPFFECIAGDDQAKKRDFPKGTILREVHEEKRTTSLYLVKGKAKLSILGPNSKENMIYTLGEGSIYPINCMKGPIFCDDYLMFSAITDLETIEFPSHKLIELCAGDEGFAETVIKHQTRLCNLFLSRIAIQMSGTTMERLCTFLYFFSQCSQGEKDLVNLSQEEIGASINLSREHISRLLKQLEDEAICIRQRKNVKILDEARLKGKAYFVIGDF